MSAPTETLATVEDDETTPRAPPIEKLPRPVTIHLNGRKNGLQAKLKILQRTLSQLSPLSPLDPTYEGILNGLKPNLMAATKNLQEYEQSTPAFLRDKLTDHIDFIEPALSSFLQYATEKGVYDAIAEAEQFLAVTEAAESIRSDRSATCSVRSEPVQNWVPRPPDRLEPPLPPIEELNVSNVTLPGVTLPSFNGDPLEYEQFMAAFTCYIHNKRTISCLDRLVHLRSMLTGEALDVIDHLPVRGENYDTALALLADSFDKPLLRQNALHTALTDIKPKSEAPRDLIACLRKVKSIVTRISRNASSPLDSSYRQQILAKFPPSCVKVVLKEEQKRQCYLPVLDIIRALENKIDLDLSMRASMVAHRTASASLLDTTPSEETCPSLQTHVYTVTQPLACFFCSAPHEPSECDRYPTTYSKKAYVLSLKRPACWICFATDHRSRSCTLPRCPRCQMDHSALLCTLETPPQVANAPTVSGQSSRPIPAPRPAPRTVFPSAAPTGANATPLGTKRTVMLSCAKDTSHLSTLPLLNLSLHHHHQSVNLIALLDSGAQRSFIAEELALKLGLQPVGSEQIRVVGFAGERPNQAYPIYKVKIACKSDWLTLRCIGIPNILGATYVPSLTNADRNALITLNLDPTRIPIGQLRPTVVIGIDYVWKLWGDESPIELPSGRTLLRSLLGPVVCGSLKDQSAQVNVMSISTCDDILSPTTIDTMAWDIFYKGAKRLPNGRISVPLPFRKEPVSLKSNYAVAKSRLHRLFEKSSGTELWEEYNRILMEQWKVGIVELAPTLPSFSPCYHIPHSAVFKPSSSTTKVRIVLDASSHAAGTKSLNDLLLPGPCLLPDLRSLHLSMRLTPILVLSDIEKAFHQVELDPEFRRYARILWLKNHNLPPSQDNLVCLQYTRLPFGITSSPFLLSAAILLHTSNSTLPIAREISRCMYVDNLITGRDDVHQAQLACKEASSLFSELGMNLREFASNEPAAISQLHPDQCAKEKEMKALGVLWNTTTDTWVIGTPDIQSTMKPSRREALSVLSSFFDPLGLWSPAVLHLRLLMNEIWTDHLNYDLLVESPKIANWLSTAKQLKAAIENNPVLRSPLSRNSNHAALEVYADASYSALGLSSYMVTDSSKSLLFAKSIVAPQATTPRLELCALLLAFQMVHSHQDQIAERVDQICFYSDSITVLHWIHSQQSPKSLFVVNRLEKMANLYSDLRERFKVDFAYVHTSRNPADLASRGVKPDILATSRLWWNAMVEDQSTNSKSERLTATFAAAFPFRSIVAAATIEHRPRALDPQNYSSYTRLLRRYKAIVVVLVKLHQQLKHRPDLQKRLQEGFRAISFTKTNPPWDWEAEALLISQHQQKARLVLESNPRLDCAIDSLGLITVRGRLPGNVNRPWLVDGKTHLAALIIRHYHQANGHTGKGTTLTRIRRRFWLHPARRPVNKELRSCVQCRRVNGRHFVLPPHKVLPTARTQQLSPFRRIGIDEAGPFRILSSKGRPESKAYVLIVNCLTTRATHLELLPDMTAHELALALRRTFARFQPPTHILLDNLSSHTLLKQCMSTNTNVIVLPPPLQHLSETLRIKWSFITPLSPWQGGVYERMVGMLKVGLKRLRERNTSWSHFHTLLSEVEVLINSRPLYPASDELDTVITPNSFLFPYPPPNLHKEPLTIPSHTSATELKRALAELNSSLDEFWKLWSTTYLDLLRERARTSRKTHTYPRPGEVVLCSDNKKDRMQWHLGRVVEIFPDENGEVRTVAVQHPDRKIYRRSPAHLFPLEVGEDGEI